MADIGSTHTAPYTQMQFSDKVTDATTTPLPLSFQGDTDTGIYRPAANTIAIVAGGVEGLRYASDGLAKISTQTNYSTGTSGTVFGQSLRPASAQATIQGWIAFNDPNGTKRFVPYW